MHDSFPRSLSEYSSDDESITLSGVYQELGLRPASLRPSTIQTHRLSNLSSISEWSRQTIGHIQSTDLSWFRLEDESWRHSRSMRGGGDKYIDLDAQNRSAGSDSSTDPKLTALPTRPRHSRFSEAEDLTVWAQADWDNPVNWKLWKKWVHVVVLSSLAFVA